MNLNWFDDFILTCLAESIGCFWWPFWSAKRQCLWPSLYSRFCWPDRWISPKHLCHFLHAEQRFRPGLPDRLVFDTLPLPHLFNTQYNSRPFDWMDDVTSSRKKPGRMNRFPPRAWRFHSGKTRGFSIIIRHFHFIFSSSLSLRFLASLLFVHLLLVFCAVHFHWWMANNTTILGKLRLSHADVAGTFCCSTR